MVITPQQLMNPQVQPTPQQLMTPLKDKRPVTPHLALFHPDEELLQCTGDLIVPAAAAQRAPDQAHVEVERLPQVAAGPQQRAAHRHDMLHVELLGWGGEEGGERGTFAAVPCPGFIWCELALSPPFPLPTSAPSQCPQPTLALLDSTLPSPHPCPSAAARTSASKISSPSPGQSLHPTVASPTATLPALPCPALCAHLVLQNEAVHEPDGHIGRRVGVQGRPSRGVVGACQGLREGLLQPGKQSKCVFILRQKNPYQEDD